VKKKKSRKKKVDKVRSEPKTIAVQGIAHNHYVMWTTQFEWQTDPFIWIASGQAYS